MTTAAVSAGTQVPLIPNFPTWCKRSEVGLKIETGHKLSFKEWSNAFSILDKTKRGHQWQIGDMLNEGETRFGDDYYQVIDPQEELEREENWGETYRKYQQVACRIESGRRRPKLFFAHHQEVAFLESKEEQDMWLDLAESTTPIMSVHKLRKAMRGEVDGGEVEPDPDLLVLQDPEVRAWLEGRLAESRAAFHTVPDCAPFLRDMTVSESEAIEWQLNRTVEIDCNVVRQAVTELLGTWQQVFTWLKERRRLISPPDVRDRLTILVANGRVKEKKEEGKKEGQKGDMKTVYLPLRNPIDDAKEG